jgi:YidC/Oxa1 family membrane protein insertase
MRTMETLRNIFDPLFNLLGATLTTFHGWGAPWWLAIIMLTAVVRTFLFPLTVRQVKSMRRMQELKPDMDEIRDKYKDDPQKQQQEMMRLYGERKVNPLGGCLPLIVQFPIFIALYYTIKQFDKLESFANGGLFWFKDLTVADPYFILPIAYVLTMMASQELTIRRTAPQQKHLMRIMPIAFGFFLMRFPAALFVYWISSNTITFVQNYFIYHRSPRKDPAEDLAIPDEGQASTEPGPQPSPAQSASGNRPAGKRKRRKKRKKGK